MSKNDSSIIVHIRIKCKQKTHYDLLPIMYKNNSSIIVGIIKWKDGIKYKNVTIVHILTYILLCYKNKSSIIVGIIGWKDRLKYKCKQ